MNGKLKALQADVSEHSTINVKEGNSDARHQFYKVHP